MIALRLPLQFSPGERFSYSNRGHNTLGAALENVEGVAKHGGDRVARSCLDLKLAKQE